MAFKLEVNLLCKLYNYCDRQLKSVWIVIILDLLKINRHAQSENYCIQVSW